MTDSMRKKSLIIGCVCFLVIAVLLALLSFAPGKKLGEIKMIADFHKSKVGHIYVFGRYNGYLNGWDIAFFHNNEDAEWFGYYLAHESSEWKSVSLNFKDGWTSIVKAGVTVAEYNNKTGEFRHHLQGVTYSKSDGRDGGVEIGKWRVP